MYDAIVVGAGPAGCAAAKALAESGLRALLVERRALPRYKSCSGQLIVKSLELVRSYFGEEVPASATCAPAENRGMILTDAAGDEFRFEQRGLNVWRSAFDGWLAERAALAGAELRDQTAALGCEEQNASVCVRMKGVREYAESARWLIVCEGAAGNLRRKLMGRSAESIVTYQTFNRGNIDLDPHYFYACLQPGLSEYDAWFNVKDGWLVLGSSAPDSASARRYHARFLDYMRGRHGLRVDETLLEDRWLLPRVRPGCAVEHGAGRVLFAGEAAGFLNPMGEGISAALESGHGAAQAVLRRFGEPEQALEEYRSRTAEACDYMRRQWSLASGFSAAFREMKL